jgi:hypothetical protein
MPDQQMPRRRSAYLVLSGAAAPAAIPPVSCSWNDVFDNMYEESEPYIEINDWSAPVQVFVGRNGSGKTRTAQALLRQLKGSVATHYLSSDRLFGLSTAGHYGGNLMGPSGEFAGVALSPDARQAARRLGDEWGYAAEALLSLHDNPEARIRLAAAIQEALGRRIDFTSRNGLIDPIVIFESLTYPLLRSEGHGLKELVILLAAIYRPDWSLLVVDEPEVNLHPSLTRLWMNLLRDECQTSRRKAVVITHEPRLVDPQSCADLEGIWLFKPLQRPVSVSTAVQPTQMTQVDEDLGYNLQLVSNLVFSSHPVLIEGDRDSAAFQSAARRIGTHSSVSQTDFIKCGGRDAVARWLEIARKLGLEVWAVADLDAIFTQAFARTADAFESIQASYVQQWQVQRTADALKPLYEAMRSTTPTPATDASRREWLRGVLASDDATTRLAKLRGEQLLNIWRDAGIWLHPQGDLERALGMDEKSDTRAYARRAEHTTEFDGAVRWAFFHFDEAISMRVMMEVEIERIAQDIQRFIRLNPQYVSTGPVGPFAEADSNLVTVQPLESGRYIITVKEPSEFGGWTLEFDRSTAPDEMHLQEPEEKAASADN